MLYKYGYNQNIGQNNTLRPKVTNNSSTNNNINIYDAMFAGWYTCLTGSKIISNNCVIRNGMTPIYQINSSYVINVIIAICNTAISTYSLYELSGFICSCTNGIGLTACYSNGPLSVFGNSLGLSNPSSLVMKALYIYSNNWGIRGGSRNKFIEGALSYDVLAVQKNNTYDLSFLNCNRQILINTKTPSSISVENRGGLNYSGRYDFESYQQIVDNHYCLNCFGDLIKTAANGSADNPTQRNGGSADVIEAVPQSLCAPYSEFELLNIRLWAEAGVSKTYRFYVQTDFATLPTAELKLYGEYLDEGTGGHLASVESDEDITARANAADWSQYVEVTINPAQTGYIGLYLRLMGYESGKKVWIDPKVVITGGDAVTVTPRWSYGEVELDIDPVATGGSGVFPVIGGGHIIQPARAA